MAVLRRQTTDESGTINLVETYSDEFWKLKQTETGIIYGHSVIDTIAGYDEQDIPFSRYHYEETDQKDEDENDE